MARALHRNREGASLVSPFEQEEGSGSSDSDMDEARQKGSLRLLLLGALLGLGVIGVLVHGMKPDYEQAAAKQAYLEANPPESFPLRVLSSPAFADMAAEHTIAFHQEGGDEHVNSLSDDQIKILKQRVVEAVGSKLQEMQENLQKKDPELARQLADLTVTEQQWSHTHSILQAMHNKRVQHLGQELAEVSQAAGGDRNKAAQLVYNHLSHHEGEVRELQELFIPNEIRNVPAGSDGRKGWEVAVGADGAVSASTNVGPWKANVNIGGEAQERHLQAVTTTERPTFGFDVIAKWVTGTAGIVVTSILSVITTFMTIIGDGRVSHLFWYLQGLLDIGVCASTFGNLGGWLTWMPCMITNFFLGIEAIWTWSK